MRWLAGAAAAVAVAGIGVAGWHAVGDGGGTNSAGTPGSGLERTVNNDYVSGSGAEPGSSPPSTIFAGGSAGSADGLIPVVRPARVSAFAQALVERPARRVPPAKFHCATPISGGPSTVVYWHGHPAVLVVNPATQTATILDCATAVHPLYSSGY
jgi:hypothetical protein